jgi:hypothetical protein
MVQASKNSRPQVSLVVSGLACGSGHAASGDLLQGLSVDAVLGHHRDPTGGHRPQRRHPPALLQQRQLAHDRPRANLSHWLAVDLDPQHPVEQQEQLVALLALLDQGPARLEAAEPWPGVGVWAPKASRHQLS